MFNSPNSKDGLFSNTMSRVKNSVSGILGSAPSSNSVSSSSPSFSDVNSSITKVVFIIFLVIVFGVLLRAGMYLVASMSQPSRSPIVVDGMISTKKETEYHVNPNHDQPKPILRSINEKQGMEFTWSTWFWINDIIHDDNEYHRTIFSKGKSIDDSTNESMMLLSSPGLYLDRNTNKIHVILNTFDDRKESTDKTYEDIAIDNIPMQKWVNVVIRVQNNTVDVYVNGTLMKRRVMNRVPKQNYGNVYVGSNKNGMNGYVSSLRYFDHAIGVGKIQDIMAHGPNLNMVGDEYEKTQPPYLALRWYFDQ